jgi:V/A-type H+-transporting ATPase subunit E
MTHDLQQLLEKINSEGVEKAKTEAAAILAQATREAQTIVTEAKRNAEQMLATAQQEAAAFERRAEETIRQSARDTVLTVEKSVGTLLAAVLQKDVNGAMSDVSMVSQLAVEAVRAYIGGGALEVAAATKMVDAIRAAVAAAAIQGVTVVTDETAGTGFKVRMAGGRIEHDFTGKAVADALAKHLRPRLAALVKE